MIQQNFSKSFFKLFCHITDLTTIFHNSSRGAVRKNFMENIRC